uniref:Uncharacterized protein n=1 Tax=Vibrio sp. FF_307 TaxID=1652834 RepID=A0A0H3ZWH4_9VIBR|nr:hypothetical protein [Vibrio sp. FF_307]
MLIMTFIEPDSQFSSVIKRMTKSLDSYDTTEPLGDHTT